MIKIFSCNDSRGVRPIWTAEEMGLEYNLEMLPFPPRYFKRIFKYKYSRNSALFGGWQSSND